MRTLTRFTIDDDEAASGSDVEGDEEEEDGEGESSDGVADGDEDADEEMTEVTESMFMLPPRSAVIANSILR